MSMTLKEKRRLKKKIRTGVDVLIASLITALILFPIIWMLPSAFKSRTELFSIPNHFFTLKPTLDNFKAVFEMRLNNYNFIRSLLVTTAIAAVTTIISVSINIIAGYAFARIEFRFKKILWVFFIVTMFVPGITIQLTSIKVVTDLNMINTMWVLIIPGLANSYQIFFFRQFYLGLPISIEEAAEIDGCSKFQTFLRVTLPISGTPLVVIGVGHFMGCYNSYIWPVLTISDNANLTQVMQIIQLIKSSMTSRYGFGIVIAATLISMTIPITIFAIFQKKIIAGIATTGLK